MSISSQLLQVDVIIVVVVTSVHSVSNVHFELITSSIKCVDYFVCQCEWKSVCETIGNVTKTFNVDDYNLQTALQLPKRRR